MTNNYNNILSMVGNSEVIEEIFNQINSGTIYLGNLHGTFRPSKDEYITFNSRGEAPCTTILELSRYYNNVLFQLSFNEPLTRVHGEFSCKNGLIVTDYEESTNQVLSKRNMEMLIEELNQKYNDSDIEHHLHFYGSNNEISQMITDLNINMDTEIIDFTRVLTQPTEEELKNEGISLPNWNLKNYGTKRNNGIIDKVIRDKDNNIDKIIFRTSESAALNFILNLSQKYHNLKFDLSYGDSTSSYDGELRCEYGLLTYHLITHMGFYYEYINEERVIEPQPEITAVDESTEGINDILSQFFD